MHFTKMHGAGNDFILLEDLDGSVPEESWPALAASLCRRKLSLGADGLMVILPPAQGGDYAMRFFNSDGSPGEMCGNGARCAARYGHDRGLAGDIQHIETTAGPVVGERVAEELYRVRLNDPTVLEPDVPVVWEGRTLRCGYAELGKPGLPYAVLHLPDWDSWEPERLRALGAFLRAHPVFPKGANVSFWREAGEGRVKAVTYERGVEDFTLACGTGAGSIAALLRLRGIFPAGLLLLDFPGGTLTVELESSSGTMRNILLTGPAVKVAEGEVWLTQ